MFYAADRRRSQRRWEIRRLKRRMRRCRDPFERQRYQIAVKKLEGHNHSEIARHLGCGRQTVVRTVRRYEAEGIEGLRDRRRGTAGGRAGPRFRERLEELVREGDPRRRGWARTNWTRESLIEQMVGEGFPRLSPTSMGRVLRAIGARLGRPRPVVFPPKGAPRRGVRAVAREVAAIPRDEVVLFADEVDIHLNPKIGRRWHMRGEQPLVVTPGKNRKRYIAGATNARTDRLSWAEGDRKNSALFVRLVWNAAGAYPRARKIHFFLDNYVIHKSQVTRRAVEQFRGRIVLHFLPPYTPQANPIERLWLDLHDKVTRNHRRRLIHHLMSDVRGFLRGRARRSRAALARAA